MDGRQMVDLLIENDIGVTRTPYDLIELSHEEQEDAKMEISSLESWPWDPACAICGLPDASKFKDYILPLLFFERLSDVYEDELKRPADEFGAAMLETAGRGPACPQTAT